MDLTIVTFLPVVAAAIILLLPQQQEQNAKYVALLFAVGGLLYSLFLFADFDVKVPSAPVLLSVDDHGILELQLLLTKS